MGGSGVHGQPWLHRSRLTPYNMECCLGGELGGEREGQGEEEEERGEAEEKARLLIHEVITSLFLSL